jgi:hypothetical protein
MDIELREAKEIQAAHDRLTAIMLGEVPNPFKRAVPPEITFALDVLCWVLQHEHNQTFGDNLAKIDAFLASRGFVLRDSGRLRVPGDGDGE